MKDIMLISLVSVLAFTFISYVFLWGLVFLHPLVNILIHF